MRAPVVSLFALIVAVSSAAVAYAAAEAEIKAVDQKFVVAFNKEDIDAIVALYAEDATTMMPGPDLWQRGSAAIREAFTDFFADCDSPTLRIHDLTYRASGNLGYGFGLYDLTYKDVKTGEMVQSKGRALSVFEKRGGKWLYVADHASVPFPPPAEASTAEPGGSASEKQ